MNQGSRSRVPVASLLGLVTLLAALGATAWLLLDDGEPRDPADPVAVEAGEARAPDLPPPLPEVEPPREAPLEGVQAPRLGPEALRGRVFDQDTGEPVEAFQIYPLEASDEPPLERLVRISPFPFHVKMGVFHHDIEPGRYDVVIMAPGYEAAVVRDVEVPGPDATPFPVPLDRGAGISGLALDDAGLPAARIKVFLEVMEIYDPTAPHPRVRLTDTDSKGRFTFSPLPEGRYSLTLLEPRNDQDRVSGVRVVAGEMTQTRLSLTPRHQVEFKVSDPRGEPVVGAVVELQAPHHFASGRSNEAGLVVLHHVPDGRYVVKLMHKDFERSTEDLELVGGSGTQIRWFTLYPPAEG